MASNESLELAKKAAAKAAISHVKSGMLLGIGSGSTVTFFIEELGKCCQNGLDIKTIPTSKKTLELLQLHHVPIGEMEKALYLDLTIDGADEIDGKKRMIKGGGGALLREKIAASNSEKILIIIDESKRVEQLGKAPLPLEVSPFCYKATEQQLRRLGYLGKWRAGEKGAVVSDNGNYIFDIIREAPWENPEEHHYRLLSLPAVLETGFFFDLADEVIVGSKDGRTQTYK